MMIKLIILIFIILQIFIKVYSNSIVINSVVLAYSDNDDLFKRVTEQFNNYSLEKQLNITLNVSTYTTSNTTDFVKKYGATIDELLYNRSKKFDVFFYDVVYSKKYSNHLLDLSNWFPREHIELFSKGVASKTCTLNGKWIGLPFNVKYSVLNFNIKLFEQYELEYPKTWDDLIEKGMIIYKHEIQRGNKDIIGYNGLVTDGEECICTLMEFIYSFRESRSNKFPGFESQEAIEALNKLKEIKEKLSSNKIFKEEDSFSIDYLLNGNAIYIKYWYFPYGNDTYKKSVLVGKNEGVSGSTIGGFNIGINKYINHEHKLAAVEVLKYFTSKEFQKNFTITEKYFTGINSLYDDEEVCSAIACDLAKQFQPIARPLLTEDYDDYSKEFRKYIFKFLYGNETALKVLSDIVDITKVYEIVLNTDTTKVGYIFFVISCGLTVIMLLSLLFLLHPRAVRTFRFLATDFWIITIIGCILPLGSIFVRYGEITSFKCHLNVLSLTFGFTFSFTPVFHRLVCNFPEKNLFSSWIRRNKYIFLLSFILVDVLLNELLFLSSYDTAVRIVREGKNFRYCKHSNFSGYAKLILIFTVKFFIIMIITLLLFLEWNLKRSIRDIRYTLFAVFITIILYIIFIVINILDIDHYIVRFILQSSIILLLSISNYLFLYAIRIVYLFQKIKANSIDLKSKFNPSSSNIVAGSKAHLRELTFRERLMFYHSSKVIIGLKAPSISKSNSKTTISASGNFGSKIISIGTNSRSGVSQSFNQEESAHEISFP